MYELKKRLLIVEDEPHIANAERIILQDGFEVHIAGDGEEGLAKAQALKPDIIVLDLMLPKLNGFEVCRRIRADKGLNGTKIVMVTAKNQSRDEAKGMDSGADDYIMKPFEPIELMHVVRQVLKQ